MRFSGAQAVGDLRDHRSDQAFLFRDRHAQLRREVGQEQFFVCVVVDHGRGQAPFEPAVRAAGHVGDSAQQTLLGGRVGADIEKLFDVGGNGLFAARAGDLSLRHAEGSDSI